MVAKATTKSTQANLDAAFLASAQELHVFAELEVEAVTDVVRRHWARLQKMIRSGAAKRKSSVDALLRKMTRETEARVDEAQERFWKKAQADTNKVWANNLPLEFWKVAFSDDPQLVLLEADEGELEVKILRRIFSYKGRSGSRKKRATAPRNKVAKKTAREKQKDGELTKEDVRKIIGANKRRMRKWSKKVTDEDKVGDIIAEGYAKGWSAERIEKRVKPFVQGYASSARRIVRNETAVIENRILEESFEKFDEVIDGFQIVNPLDEDTRPEHAHRAGRIYHKDRRKRYNVINRPALPDAVNCRCRYLPVIVGRAPRELRDGPPLDNRQFHGWFNKQNEATRRRVVGSKRYSEVKRKLREVGNAPSWLDFVDEKDGALVPLEEVKKESAIKTLRRRNKHHAKLKLKRADIRKAIKKEASDKVK